MQFVVILGQLPADATIAFEVTMIAIKSGKYKILIQKNHNIVKVLLKMLRDSAFNEMALSGYFNHESN